MRGRNVRTRWPWLLALVPCALPATSDAQPALGNLSVTATVNADCTISTSSLSFGNYNPVGTHATNPLDNQGAVIVSCTPGAATTITLGQGLNPAGGSTDAAPLRRMASGTNRLSYTLFQNMGRTTIWGNTAGTGLSYTGTGSSSNIAVYGRVAAGQIVPAGTYNDTVVATITF
jgi:spore coat protein U domain-containing protein, fimbrial subunit CupE1/2/3/6